MNGLNVVGEQTQFARENYYTKEIGEISKAIGELNACISQLSNDLTPFRKQEPMPEKENSVKQAVEYSSQTLLDLVNIKKSIREQMEIVIALKNSIEI